jgi:putative ABC transport system permease protein
MWRNYLTVGIRALARDKAYAIINIVGLALGLAACLLILLYVRYETSYDKWLPGSDRIFQVQATWHEPGQPVTRNQASPLPVRDTIAGGFPAIEAVTIVQPGRLATTRDGQPVFVDAVAVDPAFFDIFRLDFLRGSARAALPDNKSVVLTETEAIRQFGTVDALGRTITESTGDTKTDYRVTGVIRDVPNNSHMKLATIFRFDPHIYDDVPPAFKSWGTMGQYHYVRLRSAADAERINAALPAWEKRVIPAETSDGRTSSRADIMDLRLVNVSAIHLGEAQLSAVTQGNDPRTVATFVVVALLILAMACINFVNLSTARAGQRAREVALRKVLGASRGQLVTQFLGESLLIVAFAMLIALTFVELATPYLASFLDMGLRVSYFGRDGFLLPAFLLVLIVGTAGGLYPALYLSRFQPAKVLKANQGSTETEGSGRLRAILVVAQFAISIGLIACTAVVYSQTRFVQTVDPGFEREGLIQVRGAWVLGDRGSYDSFRRELIRQPDIKSVARTNLAVAGATNKTIIGVKLPGAADTTDMGFYRVDPDYFPTMGMRLLAGRLLDERHANDLIVRPADGAPQAGPSLATRGLNILINRRAAAQLGFSDPALSLGRQLRVSVDGGDPVPCAIVGVVEDTRFRTAREEVEPIIFSYDPTRTSMLVVRYRGASPARAMAELRKTWSRFLPDIPFEGAFAEDLISDLYHRERARGAIFAGFAAFAILIACLGLFGMASFTTERRTKEIGIRKVLGARIRDIVQLLAWQFSKPVIVANIVAWPVAWWAMRDWLNTFDARIPLGPGPFVVAGLVALAIAIGTVAGHAFRVARLNPIHALRYE